MFQCLIPAFFERGGMSFGEKPVPWEKMSSTLLLPEQPANTVPKPAARRTLHDEPLGKLTIRQRVKSHAKDWINLSEIYHASRPTDARG